MNDSESQSIEPENQAGDGLQIPFEERKFVEKRGYGKGGPVARPESGLPQGDEETYDRWDRETINFEIEDMKKRLGSKFKGLSLSMKQFCYNYVNNGFHPLAAYQKAYPNQGDASCGANSCIALRDPRVRREILDIIDRANVKQDVNVEWFLQLCRKHAEDGLPAAINVIKDWLGITSKMEQQKTVFHSAETKNKIKRLMERRASGEIISDLKGQL